MQPCPGLSEVQDSHISKYLGRTQVLGGGSIASQTVVHEKHGPMVRFADLDEEKRERIYIEQEHRRIWRNAHEKQKSIRNQFVPSGKPADSGKTLTKELTTNRSESTSYLSKVKVRERKGEVSR